MESHAKRKARRPEPGLVANPFVKRRNLEWRVSPPPPLRDRDRRQRAREEEEELRGRPVRGLETTVQEAALHAGLHAEAPAQDARSGPDPDAASPPRHLSLSPPSTSRQPLSLPPLHKKNDDEGHLQLAHFTRLLTAHTLRPYPASHPHLPIAAFAALHSPTRHGAHFVVTQHDHPVAGPHYDLRLQISASSAASWAIMYGLPGDANSRGKTGRGSGALRNATETRVHCLWNSFVEMATSHTGSLIVWDMGTYEVLPPATRRGRSGSARGEPSDSAEGDDASEQGGEGEEEEDDEEGTTKAARGEGSAPSLTQQQKLARAFAARKIRLQLHGARLPRTYVVHLRLTRHEDAAGRARAAAAAAAAAAGTPTRRRRRRGNKPPPPQRSNGITGPDTPRGSDDEREAEGGADGADKGNDEGRAAAVAGLSAMEAERREREDARVRRTNAYAGAHNSIGSVHQRTWFLSLDRAASGFVRERRRDDGGRVWWSRRGRTTTAATGDDGDSAAEEEEDGHRLRWPFYVRGPEHERSVVTGRLGADVLRDEGVVGYVGRRGWRPILG